MYMRKFAFILTFLIFLISTDVHAEAPESVFGAKTFTLDNGMHAVLIENDRAPVVTHMVWYNVGAIDESVGQSGIAHYMEHLMFKGSQDLEPGEFSRIIKRLGGNDNAFTAQDYTAYYETVASQHLEKVMRMEADRMMTMNPPQEEADSELQVVLEERRQRLENNPQAQFFTALRSALFYGHPYAVPVIGWRNDIEDLTLEEAITFQRKWYVPANATLVVAGDVSFNEFKKITQDVYGELPNENKPGRQDHQKIAPLQMGKLIEMGHPLIQQPLYTMMLRAPSWAQDTKASLALQVLQEYLDGSEASPLYQELVVNQKVATSINLSYGAFALGPSSLSVSAYPAEGVTFEELANALKTFFKQLKDTPISDKDLVSVKTRLQDSAIFSRDSITGPAMIVGRALASGIELNEVEHWPYLIDEITANDLQRVIETYIAGDSVHIVEGHLSPSQKEVLNEN